MNKQLDKTIPVPLYYQLKELILSEIKSGTYRFGELIPTELELETNYDISRTTVRNAIAELVQEGWLYRVKSKGTFVSKPKINQHFVQVVDSFDNEMSRLGHVPKTEVLDLQIVKPSSKLCEYFNVKESDQLIYLHRRRFADDNPIVTVETYLPYEYCQFILDHDFEKESLYNVLSNQQLTTVHKIKREIEAEPFKEKDIKHLAIEEETSILKFTSYGYSVFGDLIEYSIARYRGDKNKFEVIISNSKN